MGCRDGLPYTEDSLPRNGESPGFPGFAIGCQVYPSGIGAAGFEPATFCSQSRRANQAALRPEAVVNRVAGDAELSGRFDPSHKLHQTGEHPAMNCILSTTEPCGSACADCDPCILTRPRCRGNGRTLHVAGRKFASAGRSPGDRVRSRFFIERPADVVAQSLELFMRSEGDDDFAAAVSVVDQFHLRTECPTEFLFECG